MAEEPRTESSQTPDLAAAEAKPSRASSALTTELRAQNKQLIRYGSIAAVTTIAMGFLTLSGVSLILLRSSLPAGYNYLVLIHIVVAFLASLVSLYHIIRFEATNKIARAIFESVTDNLQAQETLGRRKRTKPQSNGGAEGPTITGMSPSQLDLVIPTSKLYIRLALKEYLSARQLPFTFSASGPLFYLFLNCAFTIIAILPPVIASLLHVN
jgi:hypothetical protein